MGIMRITRWISIAALTMAWCGGCSGDSAEREAKIREEAAKAAAQAKPVVEEASRDVKAAVEGAKEGWQKGSKKKLDLNSAAEDDLTGLPGIGPREAKRIIKARPYHEPHDLVSKKILSESAYQKLKDDVSVQ